MSTINTFSGAFFLTPDHPVGYATVISDPAGTLSDMVQNGIYFREVGTEDVVLINVEGYLISMYKTLSNQRLMQHFVARSTSIGGQNKIRWVHRSLALSMSIENAIKSVGQNVTVSDDWSDLIQINQQLSGQFIQVFSSI